MDDQDWSRDELVPADLTNRGPAPADIETAAERLGPPREWHFRVPMQAREFGLLDRTGQDGRWHDATILIAGGHLDAPRVTLTERDATTQGAFVAIAKQWYPEGLFRYPSGTVRSGDGLIATALREATEETGLEVRLTRYLLRTSGRFYLGDPDQPEREHPWQSHVFLAEPLTNEVRPQDVREIRDARIVSAEAMTHDIHPRLLQHGLGGFTYRVGLQERVLHALGLNHAPWRVPDRS